MLLPGYLSNLSSAHGQVRRRRSGNSLPSLIDGTLVALVTLASARPPARRSRCLRLSRLRPLTPRAHTHRHRSEPYRRHSELLQALKRRLTSSRPTQHMSSIRLADLDARAIPPRTRRHRRLRRPRRRHLLPHPHPHPRTNRPYSRTLPSCGALRVHLPLGRQ